MSPLEDNEETAGRHFNTVSFLPITYYNNKEIIKIVFITKKENYFIEI